MGKKRIRSAAPIGFQTDSRPIGIYIHIPFCRKKCDYCDFYSVTVDEKLIARYVSALISHIEESAERVRSNIDTIYFGGGTPSVLGAKRLIAILKAVRKKYTVDKLAEITVELNPESTDLKLLKRLRRAGFNRVSIGFQSCVDGELEKLGRIHDFDSAKQAYFAARQAGFDNISIDMMYGVESQTMESLDRSLGEIISLEPDHISFYGLKEEEGTPLYNRWDKELPSEDEQADMYLRICEALGENGYEHYEISNWCRPGYRSRHNMKYWRLEPYLGFGPAAHADCFGVRYSNVRDIKSYIDGIESDTEIIDSFEEIPAKERAAEYIMLRLRTADGIIPEDLKRLYRIDPDNLLPTVDNYTAQGLMKNDGVWTLTDNGYLLSNRIILELLEAAHTTDR